MIRELFFIRPGRRTEKTTKRPISKIECWVVKKLFVSDIFLRMDFYSIMKTTTFQPDQGRPTVVWLSVYLPYRASKQAVPLFIAYWYTRHVYCLIAMTTGDDGAWCAPSPSITHSTQAFHRVILPTSPLSPVSRGCCCCVFDPSTPTSAPKVAGIGFKPCSGLVFWSLLSGELSLLAQCGPQGLDRYGKTTKSTSMWPDCRGHRLNAVPESFSNNLPYTPKGNKYK